MSGDEARDYVIATGEADSVQEFVDLAYRSGAANEH